MRIPDSFQMLDFDNLLEFCKRFLYPGFIVYLSCSSSNFAAKTLYILCHDYSWLEESSIQTICKLVKRSLSDCWIWRRKVDVVPIPYDSLRDGRGIPLSLRKLAMLLEQNFFLISSNFRAKTLSYTFDYTLSGVTLVRRKWQFFCSDKNIVRQII